MTVKLIDLVFGEVDERMLLVFMFIWTGMRLEGIKFTLNRIKES